LYYCLIDYSKPDTGTTNGLPRGTQFDVQVTEELVTVCGDAARLSEVL